MTPLRILSVDDNPATIKGYKYILEEAEPKEFDVHLESATTYEKAKECIEGSVHAEKYDLLFLDVQLYAPNEDQPHTGEELGILARKLIPETKIIFISSFSDNLRINTIIQSVNPEGYLVKTDINDENLTTVIKRVLNNPPYYSQKALVAIRKRMANDIRIDKIDLQILRFLEQGTKNKDLEDNIGLSTSAIENRKRQLKVIFGTEGQNDFALIREAKRKGFI